MVMDPKRLEEALDGPPPTHVRNINLDTHLGAAPQRPYALLEDHLYAPEGYRTLEDLQGALAGQDAPSGLPKGAPSPYEVKDEGGDLVRYVVSAEPQETVIIDGAVKNRIRFAKRYVSLTKAGARAADEAGRPTDFWNGFTWLRGGVKPEKDFAVMAHQQQLGETDGMVFEVDASPSDAAVLRHQVARMDLATPPVPVERSEPARRSGGKE